MSKQKEPAFPCETPVAYWPGLTKLEYFSAAVLPALVTLAAQVGVDDEHVMAKDAVTLAKALLEELEK